MRMREVEFRMACVRASVREEVIVLKLRGTISDALLADLNVYEHVANE